MVNVISIPKGTALKGKEFAPCASIFFPFRDVPIMKRDAIKRITASSSSLHSMCVTFTPLNRYQTNSLSPSGSILTSILAHFESN